MVKIDLTSTKQNGQSAFFWLVLIALAVWVFTKSGPAPLPPAPKPEWPDAVILVPPVGIGGSMKIDEWGKANGVEIRRYQADADLQNAEPWVQHLYHASKGYQPCAVVSLGDGLEIIPIEDDLLEELEKLR